jgi:WD40 repeat protein
VFSLENDSFTEVHNMRQQPSNNKNHNLSFSSNAIDWSNIDTNILATAATNGCIAIWDLNKFGRQKQLNVYHDHERTTHAVSFHHQDANFLLSASQDSTIKLFDLREKGSCVSTFQSTESVRDVKFNPFNCNSFASVSENGCVHSWDVRRPEKFVQQFTAHSGPIYCLDWHPTNQWLATGSRDKLIKVWNMSNAKPQLEFTIYTIAVVGRVRWRPDRKFHIASCSLVVDYSVYIWDVRRPFIPYASFNEHTNVTTDIAFTGAPDTLISTSKDSTIYKHVTKDAHHPALAANPQSTTISPRGEILFVCKAKIKTVAPVMTTSSSGIKLFKKTAGDTVDGAVVNGAPASPSLYEQFHLAKSSLHFFSDDGSSSHASLAVSGNMRIDDAALTKTLHKDFHFFTGCAKEYRLKADDKNFLEMLEHNANVARKYGRPNVSMLWNLVKMIYKSTPMQRQPTSNVSWIFGFLMMVL